MGFFSKIKKVFTGGSGGSSTSTSSNKTDVKVDVDARSDNQITANFQNGDTKNQFDNKFDNKFSNSFNFDLNKGLEAIANATKEKNSFSGDQIEIEKAKLLQKDEQEKNKINNDIYQHQENLKYMIFFGVLGLLLTFYKGKK